MKNIYQRINEVMKQEIYVKKGSAGQGKGAEHDEVIALLVPHLVSNGIVVEVSKAADSRNRATAKGVYIFECDYNVSYVNIDEPKDRITVLVEAHAMDAGDKGPGKAMTYAAKTAHLKVFSIETGESDEGRYEALDDVISSEQVSQLVDLLCDENGRYTPKGTKVCMAFKFANINEIKSKKFDAILKAAK
jgi:hypothetical protein